MPKGSKVLMADDDKMLIDMYQERLELAGYAVTICRNGEEALAKVREIKPDIVLLDIMMPKINGYEALASIKSDPATKDIPVIMLSALMRDFNREKAVEAGADDYLIKSEAMPADVITKIEQVLSKYGKGAVPTPGVIAPNIAAPSATPPVAAVVPVSVAPAVPPIEVATPLPATPVAAQPVANPAATLDISPIGAVPVSETPLPPAPALPTPTQPEQIVFEPVQSIAPEIKPEAMPMPEPAVEKPATADTQEEVPVVKIEPQQIQPLTTQSPQPAPAMPWEPSPPLVEKPQKSPASMALLIIVAILLTALINDVIIYYFFFMNK